MGRDLCWYIIPRNIEHDTSKPVCMNLECEPEEDEVHELIYDHVNGKGAVESVLHDLSVDGVRKYNQLQKQMKDLSYDYRYRDENKDKWCSKCMMFMNGLYYCPLVIAKEHIGHSYGSPIWRSDWNIKDMYMGSSSTSFVRRFSKDKMYREISKNDIERAYDDIERLGEFFRTSDKEAKEETVMILDFLSKYMDDENVMIIFEDEV